MGRWECRAREELVMLDVSFIKPKHSWGGLMSQTYRPNSELWAFGEEGSLNKKAAFSQTMLWQSCIRKGGRERGGEGYNGIIKILIYVQVFSR